MGNDYINPIFLFILKKRKVNIIISTVILIALILLVFLWMDVYYTSNTTIIPAASNFASNLGGKINALAGLAGLGSLGGGGQSQEMYQGIINSKKLQERLLQTNFEFKDGDKNKTEKLIDFLDVKGKEPRQLKENALKLLNEEVLYTEIDGINNILTVSVSLKNPFLAAKVANKIVEYLNDIIQNQVNKEYVEQYDYLQNRISLVEDSLEYSENSLKIFLEQVRDLNSPQNTIREMRIKREILTRTTILAELKKQEEVFILENMVNLSPVKVLDVASPSYKKSRPRRSLVLISLFIIFLFLQFIVNTFIVLYRNFKNNILSRIDA